MTTETVVENTKDIRQDPMIAGILSRVPAKVAESFSEEQLLSLKAAMGAHRGHRHPLDVRGTIGLVGDRWYYVFLAGRDRRTSRRPEGRCNRWSLIIFWALFLLAGLLLGLTLLALLHWGLGLDLLQFSRELLPQVQQVAQAP